MLRRGLLPISYFLAMGMFGGVLGVLVISIAQFGFSWPRLLEFFHPFSIGIPAFAGGLTGCVIGLTARFAWSTQEAALASERSHFRILVAVGSLTIMLGAVVGIGLTIIITWMIMNAWI